MRRAFLFCAAMTFACAASSPPPPPPPPSSRAPTKEVCATASVHAGRLAERGHLLKSLDAIAQVPPECSGALEPLRRRLEGDLRADPSEDADHLIDRARALPESAAQPLLDRALVRLEEASKTKVELVLPRYARWSRDDSEWSTDGTRVAALHEGRVYLVDVPQLRVHGPFGGDAMPTSFQLSPDGKRLATTVEADHRRDVLLWDVQTGKVSGTLAGAERGRFALGGTVYVASSGPFGREETVIADAKTGAVLRTLKGALVMGGDVRAIVRNGRGLAVWDLATGALVENLAKTPPMYRGKGDFFVWEEGDVLHAYDLAAGSRVPGMSDPRCRHAQVTLDPGAGAILGATPRGDICIWSLPTGALRWVPHLGAPLGGTVDRVRLRLPFVELGIDRASRIVDTRTGKDATQADWDTMDIETFSPDRRRFATGESHLVVDRSTGQRLFSFEGKAVSFRPDGAALLVRTQTHDVTVLDAETGKMLAQALPRSPTLEALAVTADGQGIVGSGNYQVGGVILDAATLAPTRTIPPSTFVVSAGIAALHEPKLIRMLDARGERAVPFDDRGDGRVVGLSPNGHWAVGTVYDESRPLSTRGYFAIFGKDGGAPREVINPTELLPGSLELTSDGRFLIACFHNGHDCEVMGWEIASGRRTVWMEHGEVVATTVSPVGDKVAVAGHRSLRILDLATGAIVFDVPGAPTRAVRFRRDGRVLAVAYSDDAAVVDLDTGMRTADLEDSKGVTLGGFSGDGALVFGKRADGLTVWRASDGASLLRVVPLGAATLLQTRDGRIELVGDTAAGAERVGCAIGARVYPFALCADRWLSKGLLAAELRRPPRAPPVLRALKE